jgi:O-antigen ligase
MYAGILSSVLLYKKIFPEKGIAFLIPANIMILILSAVSLIFSIPFDRWTGGNGLGFMGFAGHQNILAAALLFTLPGLFLYKIKDKGTKINVERIFYFLLLSFNFLLLIITYSRASILAFTVGIIVYLILIKAKKVIISIILLTTGILVLYLTIQPFNNLFNNLLSKDGGNILGRRMILWEPSFEAAKLGGIFGLGYGVSAPDIKTPIKTGSHYEDGRYIREKGNSVLAMIEETGIVGLILFLLPIIMLIRKFKIGSDHSSFLIFNSSLIAMFVQAQFEAWWVGVGSVVLPLFLMFFFMALFPEKS